MNVTTWPRSTLCSTMAARSSARSDRAASSWGHMTSTLPSSPCRGFAARCRSATGVPAYAKRCRPKETVRRSLSGPVAARA
ncbi:Uncharacterised protein [Mycobacteroides abscessus]|nr:Uncharacterised protein [Mycobacteroides abscessus]